MSIEDNQSRSPFTTWYFITAAVAVGLVVIVGIVIAVTHTRGDDPATAPAPATSSRTAETGSSSTAPTSTGKESTSTCGLKGEVLTGTVTEAPAAAWQYEGTTAYPTSAAYGPGRTDAHGVRTCFQHSPAGALFMAANAMTQGSDPSLSEAWFTQVLAQGPYRNQLLTQGQAASSTGTRIVLSGFRLLAYDGQSARVDLAVKATAQGQVTTASGVYDLVWQDGDWKISADVAEPLDTGTVPEVAGYISWGVSTDG